MFFLTESHIPSSTNRKRFRGGTVPFPLLRGQPGFWTRRDQFNLSPVLLNMHSHFPEVLIFNNMPLLLYKDNETTASVGRPLWMLRLMGMTIQTVPTDRSCDQGGCICKIRWDKGTCLQLPTTTYVTHGCKRCLLGPCFQSCTNLTGRIRGEDKLWVCSWRDYVVLSKTNVLRPGRPGPNFWYHSLLIGYVTLQRYISPVSHPSYELLSWL